MVMRVCSTEDVMVQLQETLPGQQDSHEIQDGDDRSGRGAGCEGRSP